LRATRGAYRRQGGRSIDDAGSVIVRVATARDAPAVTSAYVEAWRAGYQGLLADDELEAQARTRASYDWRDAIARTDRIVKVAEDEQIVGVVECEHAPPAGRRPWLHRLYVVPSAWGTGAATALLDEALAAVNRSQYPTVWLSVVEAQARARRFYERQGWRLDTETPPGTNGFFQLLHYRHDI
jgi:RimJ/RimL family protein N-acetyltransferase